MAKNRARSALAGVLVSAFAFLAVSAPAKSAHACSATQTQVYQSATTVWCVEKTIITKYGAFPTVFFPFGDSVIKELVTLFNVPAKGVYTFEASLQTGGAHTGSECCGLGVTVTGDAFYNVAYGVNGFWGYLLALHESINDWTGQVTSGWPTDYWADHVSAFPNSMDWHIMDTLGTLNHDMNLVKAAAAQKARFYPGGDSVDPRVSMFDQIFALPNMGYPGLARIFGYIEGDKLSWDNLGVPNPDEKRSEYVVAYLSLGAGKSLLPLMQSADVCNGKSDGKGDPVYTCKEANIDAIATAHCAIAAAAAQGSNETADLTALRSGNYPGVAAKGKCGAGCPSECGCKTAANLCVASWLSDSPVGDGGAATVDAGAPAGDAGTGAADAGIPNGNDAGSGGATQGCAYDARERLPIAPVVMMLAVLVLAGVGARRQTRAMRR